MRKRSGLRWFLLVVGLFFFGVVIADSLGWFSRNKPYDEIPHGDHVHYVPKDRDPAVPVGNFPTQAPGPGQRITPQGQIVDEAPAP